MKMSEVTPDLWGRTARVLHYVPGVCHEGQVITLIEPYHVHGVGPLNTKGSNNAPRIIPPDVEIEVQGQEADA